MKVIFLDIDGVLITRETCRRGFGLVDSECVQRLNRLIWETAAGLVLSSCWRIGQSMINSREQLSRWGVRGNLIGQTPYDPNLQRGEEIQQWITEYKQHCELESFVIIDDDRDMAHLLPFLVKTTFELGLQDEHVEEAKGILFKISH